MKPIILEENNEDAAHSKMQNDLNSTNDIAEMFSLYRAVAEANEKKLKEAEFAIDRLKECVETSKEVESNLRYQLESSQKRLIRNQKVLSQFTNISAKQREHENITISIERKLDEFNKIIVEFREKSKNVYETVTKEINLMNEIKGLKAALKTSQLSYDLLKTENEALQKEKIELETQFDQKLKTYQNDLNKSKLEMDEVKEQRDATVLMYKKQIEHYKIVIEEYEKERRSLLEDFELPKQCQDSLISKVKNLNGLDKTIIASSNESFPVGVEKNGKEHLKDFISQSNTQPSIKYSTKVKVRSAKALSQNTFGRSGTKQKLPPLDFLTSNEKEFIESSSATLNKRRLFSNNDYDYLA